MRNVRTRGDMRRQVFIALGLLVFGVATLSFLSTTFYEPRLSLSDIRSAREFLRNLLEEFSTPDAYLRYASAITASSNTTLEQHFLAHIAGEELYGAGGKFADCTLPQEPFAFGCFHGFSIRAITEEGDSILPQLAASCRESFGDQSLPCEHGLGHGVLAALGLEALTPALELCGSASKRYRGGCATGVFMEYNFPTDPTHTRLIVRERGEDLHEPCPRVASRWQGDCYLELPQWWLRILDKDVEAVGALCASVTAEEERAMCYEGIGVHMPAAWHYDRDATAKACMRLSLQPRIRCIEGAASIFITLPGRDREALILCDTLPPESASRCRARIEQNPFFEV